MSQKGSNFERDICKQFSRWWSYGERDDIFWRTAGSGARASMRFKKFIPTHDSAGDIMAIDPIGKPFTEKFLIELKRGYGGERRKTKDKKNKKTKQHISVLSMIDNRSKQKQILIEWWNKAQKECRAHKRKGSLIIFKRDGKQSCLFMSYDCFNYIFYMSNLYPTFKFPYITIHTEENVFIIFRLKDFFKIDPKCFIKRKIKRR